MEGWTVLLAARSFASRMFALFLLLSILTCGGLAVFSAVRAVVEGVSLAWDEVILFAVAAEVAGMMLRDWVGE
jgi:hypothetical protein